MYENTIRKQLTKTGKTIQGLHDFLVEKGLPRTRKSIHAWVRGAAMPDTELVFLLENYLEAPFWVLYPGIPGRDGK